MQWQNNTEFAVFVACCRRSGRRSLRTSIHPIRHRIELPSIRRPPCLLLPLNLTERTLNKTKINIHKSHTPHTVEHTHNDTNSTIAANYYQHYLLLVSLLSLLL